MCDSIVINGGNVSIQISGPCVPADGSVTAATINSGAATDGQVLTADGAGGTAWEGVVVPDGAVGPRQVNSGYTRVTRALADNLDSYTTINFGERKVLRFSLPSHRGTAVVTLDNKDLVARPLVGGVIGGLSFLSARTTNLPNDINVTMIVFEDHTKAVRGGNRATGMETGGVYEGQSYADGSGVLFGWYSGDNSGPFVLGNGKGRIESAWLTADTLNIAINSAATSGGPFTLTGNLWIVY